MDKTLTSFGRLLCDEDIETAKNALWVFAFVCQSPRVPTMVWETPDFFKAVKKFLNHPEDEVVLVAVRLVGDLICKSDNYAETMVKEGLNEIFVSLLHHEYAAVRKETAICLSDLWRDQEGVSLASNELLESLLDLIIVEEDSFVLSEAGLALTTALVSSDLKSRLRLVQGAYFINAYARCLFNDDQSLVETAYECVPNVLHATQLICGSRSTENCFVEYLRAVCGDNVDHMIESGGDMALNALKLREAFLGLAFPS